MSPRKSIKGLTFYVYALKEQDYESLIKQSMLVPPVPPVMYKIAIEKVAITQRTGISHTLDIHEAWIIPTFKTQQRPKLLLSRMIFD